MKRMLVLPPICISSPKGGSEAHLVFSFLQCEKKLSFPGHLYIPSALVCWLHIDDTSFASSTA